MKGYRTSKDYKKLKELLDKGYIVVLLWVHDATSNLFAGIARRVPHIQGGVDGDWYSLDSWSYFPTINRETFEEYCQGRGFTFILPEEE